MKTSTEIEGGTIDDAIAAGLKELGIERSAARVEILRDARRGLLGFGGQKALVRVTVRASLTAAEEDPPPVESPLPAPEVAEAPKRAAKAQAPKRAAKAEAPKRVAEKRAGRDAARQADPIPDERAKTPATFAGEPPAAATAPVSRGPVEAQVAEVLGGILERMGLQATLEETVGSDGARVVEIQSDSGGLLIGRQGQTLDALEYLVNRIVGRSEDAQGRIVIDTEGYRRRREERIAEMAGETGEKVRQGGREVKLAPMSPRDRRIVHMALRSVEGVETRSTGEGYLRQVVISPAGRRAPKRARRSSESA